MGYMSRFPTSNEPERPDPIGDALARRWPPEQETKPEPPREKREPALAYRVIHQSRCEACDGSGMVQHPIWVEFWEPWRDLSLPCPIPENFYDDRARELGYPNSAAMPEEEIECSACQGSGYVRREVPLVVALEALGVLRP